MANVGGRLQAQFMARIRGRDPERCLVVPIDVGKSAAMSLIADHYGEVVVAPFEFALTETGFGVLAGMIARAEATRSAEIVRVGGGIGRALPPHPRGPPAHRRPRGRRAQPGGGQGGPGPAAAAPAQERRPRPGGDGRADDPWRRPTAGGAHRRARHPGRLGRPPPAQGWRPWRWPTRSSARSTSPSPASTAASVTCSAPVPVG